MIGKHLNALELFTATSRLFILLCQTSCARHSTLRPPHNGQNVVCVADFYRLYTTDSSQNVAPVQPPLLFHEIKVPLRNSRITRFRWVNLCEYSILTVYFNIYSEHFTYYKLIGNKHIIYHNLPDKLAPHRSEINCFRGIRKIYIIFNSSNNIFLSSII